jgi:hypothetical protein
VLLFKTTACNLNHHNHLCPHFSLPINPKTTVSFFCFPLPVGLHLQTQLHHHQIPIHLTVDFTKPSLTSPFQPITTAATISPSISPMAAPKQSPHHQTSYAMFNSAPSPAKITNTNSNHHSINQSRAQISNRLAGKKRKNKKNTGREKNKDGKRKEKKDAAASS